MDETLHTQIGRTRPAQAPLATASPMASIPIPPTLNPAVPARAIELPNPTAPPAPSPPLAPQPETATDEERALLYVLRLVDRTLGPGILSPVERAFVEGAKVMFEQLASACAAMLDRKVADYTRGAANPAEPPRATVPPDASKKGNRSTRSVPKPPKEPAS